jgi:hypothetical protein
LLYMWSDMNINYSNLVSILAVNESEIYAVFNDESNTRKVLLTYGESSEKKEEFVCAVTSIYDNDLRDEIIRWNLEQDSYKICLKEYAGSEGLDRLDADIISGNGPDIIEMSGVSRPHCDAYAEKGLLVDLKPYLKADGFWDEERYLVNLWEANCIGDELYQIPYSFHLLGSMVSDEYYKGQKTWTPEAVMNLAEKYPDAQLLYDENPEKILTFLLYGCISQYVDRENKYCDFISTDFTELLRFANIFQNKSAYNQSELFSLIEERKPLLIECTAKMNIAMYALYEKMWGTDLLPAGYPTQNGGKMVFSNGFTLAMNSTSAKKEVLWDFMSRFLAEQQQEKIFEAFPVMITVCNNKMDHSAVCGYVGDIRVESPGISEDLKKKLLSCILEINEINAVDEDVLNIILEEANYYFHGVKTEQETADVIQSRINIFINE